jgi:PmbA protein
MELRNAAEYTLKTLTSLGADQADCWVSGGRTDELNYDAGKFTLMRTTFDSNLQIKAIVGGKKGVFSTNKLDKDSIYMAAKTALEAARASEPDEAEGIAEFIGEHDFFDGVREPDLEKLYDRFAEMTDELKTNYPKTKITDSNARFTYGDSLFMNTNGTKVLAGTGFYTLGATIGSKDGDKVSAMNGIGYSSYSLDAPILDFALNRRIVEESERQIDTVPVAGKFTGKLLVSPGCLTDLLGAIFSACLYDAHLIAGDSPWKDKLGKQVAATSLSVSLDPLDARMVGGDRLTGDGYLAEKQDAIKNGILAGFALSRYASKKTGFKRGGNTSGFYVVEPGCMTYDELLGSTERGILLSRFSGGQPSLNGDISGVAKNSFLIEKGRIGAAVSETMISGNLLEMLHQITGIGSELICDGSSVMPWIVFDGVTISGK